MEILAIIPARGGSKGIPQKNIRLLADYPLISYTINQAKRSKWISRLVVSTDDKEIADISSQYNAEIVMRPPEISGDLASSESALLHVVETLKAEEGYFPDLLVFLQCTSPLTLVKDIDGTIQSLIKADADTAFSAVPFHYFVWRKGSNGCAEGINHDKSVRLLRQEREDQYLETGAVYVMKTDGFLKSKHRFFGKTILYEMPAERCFEIDDPVDLEIAEKLLLSLRDT